MCFAHFSPSSHLEFQLFGDFSMPPEFLLWSAFLFFMHVPIWAIWKVKSSGDMPVYSNFVLFCLLIFLCILPGKNAAAICCAHLSPPFHLGSLSFGKIEYGLETGMIYFIFSPSFFFDSFFSALSWWNRCFLWWYFFWVLVAVVIRFPQFLHVPPWKCTCFVLASNYSCDLICPVCLQVITGAFRYLSELLVFSSFLVRSAWFTCFFRV